jgi:ABC-type transport system involved in multi-copper enzyme maturation permease subunit
VTTIYLLALQRARVRILVSALGFGLFEMVVGLSYASVDQNAVRQLVDALPPALKVLAGSTDIASPTGYLGSGYLHPVALAIQGAIAISMAAAPAREAEDGTAELVLARPLAPFRWLGAHALAMATGLAIVVAGGYAGGLVAALTVNDLASVEAGPLAGAAAMGFLCFLAVGGVALVVASLVRAGGRAVGWAAGFLLVSYALDYLAQVWSLVEPLGPLSIFHYLDPQAILGEGSVGVADAAVLGGAALVACAAALVLIERRDLTP